MDTVTNLIDIVKQISELDSQEDVETALAVLKALRPAKQIDFPETELVEKPAPAPVAVQIPWKNYQIEPIQVSSSVEVGRKVSLSALYRALDTLGWNLMTKPYESAADEQEVSVSVRVPADLTISGITILDKDEFLQYRDFIPDTGIQRWILRGADSSGNVTVKSKKQVDGPSNKDMLRPVIRFSTELSDLPLIGSSFMLGKECFTVIDKDTAIRTEPIAARYWTAWTLYQLDYDESGFQRYLECWIRRTLLPCGALGEHIDQEFPEGDTYQVDLDRDVTVENVRPFSRTDYLRYCGFIPMIQEKWCGCIPGGRYFPEYILNNGDSAPSGSPFSYAIRTVVEFKSQNGFSAKPGDKLIINGRAFTVFTEGEAVSNQAMGYVMYGVKTHYKWVLMVDGKEYDASILQNASYVQQLIQAWLRGEAYEAPEGALR